VARPDSTHDEIVSGDYRFRKGPYTPPEEGAFYVVRDKTKGERIIEVVKTDADGAHVDVVTHQKGHKSRHAVRLAVESLARQAAKGWCSRLIRVAAEAGDEDAADENASDAAESPAMDESTASDSTTNVMLRLDIQNFSRCSADIARAGIRFDTQLIKDIADGPFRAGKYEQAFITCEQITSGFTAAVGNSRRAIADGRRALTAQKGKLSGREIEERKAAFVRSEQLIGAAERSFSTILEGLRMYLRAQQG
jgi:hypothetical protein